MKDYISLIINDGKKRLMSKEKAYSLLVSKSPLCAASFSDLLARDASFILIVEENKVQELTIDEAYKISEIKEKARDEFRTSSSDVLAEAERVRQAAQRDRDLIHKGLQDFKKQDDFIQNISRQMGYDPNARSQDAGLIRRRDRFKI